MPVQKTSVLDSSWSKVGRGVDPAALLNVQRGLLDVQRLAQGVPHVAERHVADGHGDRVTGVANLGATDQAVGRLHRDGAHDVVTDVLRDLEGQGPVLDIALAGVERDVHLQRVEEFRHLLGRELDVDDRTGDPPPGPRR